MSGEQEIRSQPSAGRGRAVVAWTDRRLLAFAMLAAGILLAVTPPLVPLLMTSGLLLLITPSRVRP